MAKGKMYAMKTLRRNAQRMAHFAPAGCLAAVILCLGFLALNPVASAGRTPTCPSDMAFVPAGDYSFGTSKDKIKHIMKICKESIGNCNDQWFSPESQHYGHAKMQPVCVDRFEYPNEAGKLPATGADWRTAMKLCEARGKTLCADLEWEMACAAGTRRAWPFGGVFEKHACNVEGRGIEPSGSRAACVSPVGGGIYDMAGNAAEWTLSTMDEVYPDQGSRHYRVIKGGSYMDHPLFTRCAFRDAYDPAVNYDTFGFRCCSRPR
jgi:formylglycine-generating enzyme required for sulfatase activity